MFGTNREDGNNYTVTNWKLKKAKGKPRKIWTDNPLDDIKKKPRE
jgi:hypothetical protein